MIIAPICIAGGLIYAGVMTYMKHRRQQQFVWLVGERGQPITKEAVVIDAFSIRELEEQIDHGLLLSTLAVGLTAAGKLIFTPVLFVAVPLSVFTALPVFEESLEALVLDQDVKPVVLSSVVIVVGLLTNLQIIGAVVLWLHYFNYRLLLDLTNPDPSMAVRSPAPRRKSVVIK